MPTRKTAKKVSTPAKKKTAAKKTVAKKAAPKKAVAKKAAPKKVVAKKPAPKKTVAKKAAPKKAVAKKAAPKKAVAKKAAPKKAVVNKKAVEIVKKSTKKPAKKAATQTGKSASRKKAKPKASDFIKRPSHTPAIFKPASKRMTHIYFSLEEVKEVLESRPKEERLNGKKKKRTKAATKADAGKAPIDASAEQKKSKHHAASLDDILGISTGGAGKHGGSVPRKWNKYHKLLIELRDHVRAELNLHSNDTLKRSQKEDAGDLSISVDAGTDNFDRDFALSLLSTEQESLKEIEAAIKRIHDGSYGVCEVTGEAISAERLEAVPFTRFSLQGQREFEMNARKRVSRAGAFLNEAGSETISFGDDDGDN
jgi:RNA polymerase-binding transcription factor DksA